MTRSRRKPTPTWDQLKTYVEGALRRERNRADDRLAKAVSGELMARERSESAIYEYVDRIALAVAKHRSVLDLPSDQ